MNVTEIASSIDLEIVLRIVISVTLGFFIGMERELTSKWAGLRTHILVCLGSTIFTVLSIYAFPTITSPDNPVGFGDPARIAAQILTGIGFIGGGTVLRHGPSVYGLTTAATLWISAAIGMAVGTGDYFIATISTLITVLILTLIRHLEWGIINKHRKKHSRIRVIVSCKTEYIDSIIDCICDKFASISGISKKKTAKTDDFVKIIVKLKVFANNPIKEVYKIFKSIDNIVVLNVDQYYEE